MDGSAQTNAFAMDVLPVGYLAVTRSGKVLAANEMFRGWCGGRGRDLVDFSAFELIEEAQRGALASLLDEPVDAPPQNVVEVSIRAECGPARRLQVAGKVQETATSPMVHLVFTDISERHRAAEELREINIEQEAFTHSISHDLRAPLVTITNYSEYLANECSPALDATAKDVLTRIQRAAQRMDNVLQNLLLYSRVGRAEMFFAPVDVANLVTEILIQHDGLIQEKHANIEMVKPFFSVHASRELLGQVLANLLTNALKYTPPERDPCITFSAQAQKDSVVICVEDNGIGIEAADFERIFQIFERLHGQAAYPGTGIGLAVVRRAVDRMNGKIWVESAVGSGSRFFVQLPN